MDAELSGLQLGVQYGVPTSQQGFSLPPHGPLGPNHSSNPIPCSWHSGQVLTLASLARRHVRRAAKRLRVSDSKRKWHLDTHACLALHDEEGGHAGTALPRVWTSAHVCGSVLLSNPAWKLGQVPPRREKSPKNAMSDSPTIGCDCVRDELAVDTGHHPDGFQTRDLEENSQEPREQADPRRGE